MLVSIQHTIDVTYSAPISESTMDLHLVPQTDGHQTLLDFKIVAGPEARLFEYADGLGNRVRHFSTEPSHDRAVVVTNSHVEIHPQHWLLEQCGESIPHLTPDHQYQEFLLPHGPVQFDPRLELFASEAGLNREMRTTQALAAIVTQLCSVVTFARAATYHGGACVAEVLTRGKGNARDCAHVALSLLRHLGIPARYVSGYLFRRGMPELDLHAWVEALVPTLGWIGIDPTRGQVIGDAHVALAIGRSSLDVPTQRGAFRGQAQQQVKQSVRGLDVHMDRKNEWFQTPRFDSRQLVELMLRDRMATRESLEQQILQ